MEEVEGDCPDCKPAFDNKTGRKPRIKLNFTPKSPCPPRVIMQEVHQNQLTGTFAEINQQHNQFGYLDRQARKMHKTEVFLDWLDNIDQPGPNNVDAVSCKPSPPQPQASASSSSSPKLKNTPPSSGPSSPKQSRRLRALREKWWSDLGRISPPPLPTPPTTTTKTINKDVRGEYTLCSRENTLSADQRRAMRALGWEHIRRLTVVSRRHHRRRSDPSNSSEYTTEARRHTLSAGQRAALRRSGRGNVRRITVIGPRRRPPFY